MRKGLLALALLVASLRLTAQCDQNGILLELQATTGLNGLLIGNGTCLSTAAVSSPLSYSGGTLSIIAGAYPIVKDTSLHGFGTTANPLGINGYAGASNGQIPSKAAAGGVVWITPAGATDLTFSGSSSPVTLNSSTGTDVTLTAVGILSFSATSGNITMTANEVDGSITNELDSKWTDAGVFTYLTATGDRAVIGSATELNTAYKFQVNGPTFTQGVGAFQGIGSPTGTLASASIRLWNTTATTGDIWYLGSENLGTFTINGNPGTVVTITTAGNFQVANLLRIGSVAGITPTSVIGRNGSGDVGALGLSGLSIVSGTLTNSFTGTVTSVAATAPAAGFTISGSPITTSGTLVFTLANDLAAYEGLSTTGIVVRTAANVATTRTITGSGSISVSNGDGVSGNPTISFTGTVPTVLTLNNGLTLTGTNGQWGGALVQNTTIDGQTFYQLHKDGRIVTQRYESNPVTSVNVTSAIDHTGIAANPITAVTPAEDAVVTIRGYTNGTSTYSPNVVGFGIYTTDAAGTWEQSRSESAYNSYRPKSINPNGGKVSVGRRHNSDIPDALMTIAATGLTGTTVVGSLLQLENQEGSGNSYMTIGTGTDIHDMGLGWFDGNTSARLYNMTTTSGSLLQFGFTQDPSELVIQRNASGGTSNVGIGHGTFSNIDSRLQVNGSVAFGAFVTSSTAVTLDDTHFHIVCTAAGASAYTIPVASTCVERIYWIENNSNFTITLSQSFTRFFGATTQITSGQTAWIQATAAGWFGSKYAQQ